MHRKETPGFSRGEHVNDNDQTGQCPVCRQRMPAVKFRATDGDVSRLAVATVGITLIQIGLWGFFIGLGLGVLSFLGLGGALHYVGQRRLDRIHADHITKTIKGHRVDSV